MKLGALIMLNSETATKMRKLKELGLETCQLCCWDHEFFTEEKAKEIDEVREETGIIITELWGGWSAPRVWNFKEGPITLGLVPEAYRAKRLDELKRCADFAKRLNITDMITHAGFIPEVMYSKEYYGTLVALQEIVGYCKSNDLYFDFETGQETPITLKRMITDLNSDNIGVNFDPANLICYGKANPVDALDVLGPYVRGVHGKDAMYPVADPYHTGEEKPLGQGQVNYPAFVPKLKSFGYDRSITIEREIEGDEQIADIKMAKEILEKLI